LQLALLVLLGLHLGFGVRAEGDIQMLADKVAEVAVETVVLLLLEGGLGVALDEVFPLKIELLDPFFPGGAATSATLSASIWISPSARTPKPRCRPSSTSSASCKKPSPSATSS
jgi:hypothetical protein